MRIELEEHRRRALIGVGYKLITPIIGIVAVYLFLFLALNSRIGSKQALRILNEVLPGSVSIEYLELQPSLNRLEAWGVSLRDTNSREVIRARNLSCSLDRTAVFSRHIDLHDCSGFDGAVLVHTEDDGALGLARAVAGQNPKKGDGNSPWSIRFFNVNLLDIDLLINLGDMAMLFEDTAASGGDLDLTTDGFQMELATIRATGGRLMFSERMLNLGPGKHNTAMLEWEVLRRQNPWLAMRSEIPAPPEGKRGILALPVHDLRIDGVRWHREWINFERLALLAADIDIDAGGWIQFLPEKPKVGPREMGGINVDGRARISLTPDSPAIQWAVPGLIHGIPEYGPDSQIKPMSFDAWGNVRFFEGSTTLEFENVQVLGWPVDSFRGELALFDGRLTLAPGATMDVWGGTVTGGAWMIPQTGEYEARLCATGLRVPDALERFGEIDDPVMRRFASAVISTSPSQCTTLDDSGIVFAGDLTMKAMFDRDPAADTPEDKEIQPPMLSVRTRGLRLNWPGSSGLPAASATVDLDATLDQRGRIELIPENGRDGLSVRAGDDSIAYRGVIDTVAQSLSRSYVEIHAADLAAWADVFGIDGVPTGMGVDATGNIHGDMSNPALDRLSLSVDRPVGDDSLPDFAFDADIDMSGGRMNFGTVDIDTSIGDVQVSGWIDPIGSGIFDVNPNMSMDLHVEVADIDLGTLPLQLPFGGDIVFADADISGSLDNPNASGSFLANDIVVGQEFVEIVQSDFELSDNRLSLTDLYVIKGKGEVTGDFAWDMTGNDIAFDLRGREFLLEEIQTLSTSTARTMGAMRFDVAGSGPIDNLDLEGSIIVDDLQAAGRYFGRGVIVLDSFDGGVEASGTIAGDVDFALRSTFDRGPVELSGHFRHLPVTAWAPELRDAFGGSHATGTFDARLDPFDTQSYEVSATISDVTLLTGARVFELGQPANVRFAMAPDGTGRLAPELSVDQFLLGAEGRYLSASGEISEFQSVDARIQGELDLSILQFLPELIVDAEGVANVDLVLSGALDDPDMNGTIEFGEARIAPRGLGTSAHFDRGRLVVGNDRARIEESNPLVGNLYGGDFVAWGEIGLDGFIPHAFDIRYQTTAMTYRIPNELNITLNLDVEVAAQQIAVPETWSIAGDVEIVDARYYKEFDLISDSISIGGIGRTVSQFSLPIWQTNKIVRALDADLVITGRDRFMFESTIANAEFDMEFRTDLKLTGRLGEMELVGEMQMLDGSRVVYSGRRFAVDSGTLLFNGFIDENGFPWPLLDAELTTSLKSTCSARRRGTLDTAADEATGRTVDESQAIFISADVEGRLPLGMTFALESTPFYDQRDQISLILTGCSVDELTSGSGAAPTLELLFGPVIDVVERNVESQLNVDDVDLIPTPEGTAEIVIEDEVSERFTWTLDAAIGTGAQNRQSLAGRYTLFDWLTFELLEESQPDEPVTIDSSLRFRLRLD